MGDGQDTNCRRAVLQRRNDRQNQGGTILVALFLSLQMLPYATDRNSEKPSRSLVQSAACLPFSSSALR